jgi:hypothetical protein
MNKAASAAKPAAAPTPIPALAPAERSLGGFAISGAMGIEDDEAVVNMLSPIPNVVARVDAEPNGVLLVDMDAVLVKGPSLAATLIADEVPQHSVFSLPQQKVILSGQGVTSALSLIS